MVWFFGAGVVGLATSVAFVYITQYYTAGSYRPVQEIAEASQDRPGDQHHLRHRGRLRDDLRDRRSRSASRSSRATGSAQQAGIVSADGAQRGGIFGTAVATMGMLMTAAYILAMDTFGPITDNAGGIAEISRAEAGAREITDRLDAVGNTTKALTKGYAIASASLAAFLLFSAYIDKVNLILGADQRQAGSTGPRSTWPTSTCSSPRCSARCWSTSSARWRSARSAAAQAIILEVRRQFRETPGSWPTPAPGLRPLRRHHDQGRAQEMVAPGLLAVAIPIVVGVVLGTRPRPAC